MKCVKTTNGSIMRISDKEADELVDNKEYFYCPKWDWKDANGKEYKGERRYTKSKYLS